MSKKLNKKELLLLIISIMITAFLITLLTSNMEVYWLRVVIIIGTMAVVGIILRLRIRWNRYR